MSYTYDVTTDRGKVRFLIGDTTSDSPAVQGEDYAFEDNEIDALLSMNTEDVWAAAADGCRRLAADEILGAIRLNWSGFSLDKKDVPKYWLELAGKYDAKSTAGDLTEFVDSFDHEISEYGEDVTEYVGDIT